MSNKDGYDMVGALLAFEADRLEGPDTIILFAHLVKSGLAWRLQGFYGRTAAALIDNGILDRAGSILKEVE